MALLIRGHFNWEPEQCRHQRRCPGRGPASPKAWDRAELCTFPGWQGLRMREDVSEMKLDGYQGPDQDFSLYSKENGKITGGLWARESCMLSDFSSVAQSCPTLYDPMNCNTPGFPIHHQFLELAQTHHVHWVSDAIQLSHHLLSPSPAFNLSQHRGLFQGVSSSHQVAL